MNALRRFMLFCGWAALIFSLTMLAQPAEHKAGSLGILFEETDDGLCKVRALSADGPAAKAGMKAGDVILAIQGEEADSFDAVVEKVRTEAGAQITVRVRHLDGTLETLKMTSVPAGTLQAPAQAPPAPPQQPAPPPRNPLDTAPTKTREKPSAKGDSSLTVDATSPLLVLMPELKTAPPPSWVKPGTRLTFHAAAATTINIADPDYKGAAAYSYIELNVVAVEENAVVIDQRIYTVNPEGGPLLAPDRGGYVFPAGAASDYWVNPDVLKKHVAEPGGFKYFRAPYKVGDQTYNSVILKFKTVSGYQNWVYDEETGVLLHMGMAQQGNPPDREDERNKDLIIATPTQRAECTFASRRDLKLPWAGSAAPAWLGTIKAVNFSGAQSVTVPGVPPVSIPLTGRWEITGHGKESLQGTETIRVDVPNMGPQIATKPYVSGTSQIGGRWIHPESLAALRQGQEIDKDPITKVTAAVSFTGRDRNGRDIVTLTESGSTQQIDFVYDKSTGMLIGVIVHDPRNMAVYEAWYKSQE
jgi:hypothetical protein